MCVSNFLRLRISSSLASTCVILTPGERCSSENVAERALSFWLPLPFETVAEESEAARFSEAT